MFDLYVKIFEIIGLPDAFAEITWPVFPFACIAALVIIVVLFLVLMERKVLAWLTIRKGPNRVGPFGFFQTIADAIKLLFKEDIMSTETDKILFTIAPIIVFAPVMIIYGLMPFTENLVAVNLAAGLFLVFALSSLTTVGIVLAGWSSNNKYSLLGGMRSAAQAISYEIPLVIAVLSVAVLAGSLNMVEIVNNQSGGVADTPILDWNIFSWNIWPGFIGFIVLFICSLAEVNRIPFDLPEAESELVSGYNTEYSGMKFALFFLAEYSALFIICVLIATLFLGGYLPPFSEYLSVLLFRNFVENQDIMSALIHLEQGFWLIVKTYTLIFFVIWIRATLPRLRSDQLMAFSWKYLLPLALFNLILVSVFKYFITSVGIC
jgi:NADH-quinone oxidoreductase subunit H